MKHWISGISLIVVVTSSGAAQEPPGGLKKHPVKRLSTGNAPVTRAEARATFMRVETVLREALGMPAATPRVSIAAGAGAVRRDQVVAEMFRVYSVLRPKVKMTPHAVRFDAGQLRMADPTQKANLTYLVRLGAVARIGALATGPGDTMTIPHFGDAVGFFMAKMAEITHMPSSKWTPELRDEGQ